MNKNLKLLLFAIASIFGAISNLSAQSPNFRLPAFIRHSTEDLNVNKNASLQFTLTQDGKLYFKENLINQSILEKTVKNHFETGISVRQAYIKGDVDAKVGNLLELSTGLYKTAEITDIRLVVIPYKLVVIPSENIQETLEKRGDGYTLNLRLSSREIEKKIEIAGKQTESRFSEDDPPPPPVKNASKPPATKLPAKKPPQMSPIVIGRKSYNQMTLNGLAKSEKELLTEVEKIFKQRDEFKIFRSGTNEIDKSVYLKVSPDLEFRYLVGLADSLYGIGANLIYLKTDEFAK